MNINQLRAFIEVEKNNFNFTLAAESLYTTQPTISKQLRALEDSLGVNVIFRKNKTSCELTEDGKRILVLAKEIVSSFEKMKHLTSGKKHEGDIVLNIATTHTQIRYKISHFLNGYLTSHPAVRVNFHQGTPAQIAQMLHNGDVDFAIATEAMHLFAEMYCLPCYRWGRSVIARQDHEISRINTLTLMDISMFDIVTYIFGFTGQSKLDNAFKTQGVTPRVVITATDTNVIKHFVRKNIGIGVIASCSYDPENDTDLICVNIDHLVEPSCTYICINKQKYLSADMIDFISCYAPHLSLNEIANFNQQDPSPVISSFPFL